jgi:hypothetical protein
MDLIILQDGLYQLIPTTKEMFVGAIKPEIVDCFSLCEIVKNIQTSYLESINKYVMVDSGAYFYGCICN